MYTTFNNEDSNVLFTEYISEFGMFLKVNSDYFYINQLRIL
jgi:hypothetical protein